MKDNKNRIYFSLFGYKHGDGYLYPMLQLLIQVREIPERLYADLLNMSFRRDGYFVLMNGRIYYKVDVPISVVTQTDSIRNTNLSQIIYVALTDVRRANLIE